MKQMVFGVALLAMAAFLSSCMQNNMHACSNMCGPVGVKSFDAATSACTCKSLSEVCGVQKDQK